MDNLDTIVIPEGRTPDTVPQDLEYYLEDERPNSNSESPLFGGRQTWVQRDESFKLNTTMKVPLHG